MVSVALALREGECSENRAGESQIREKGARAGEGGAGGQNQKGYEKAREGRERERGGGGEG